MNTLHTDFWMDRSADVDVLTGERLDYGKDYIKLAATRRAITNFVSIVTGKTIPVTYSTTDDSYTDGRHVVISSRIDDSNFDSTVGLALHEGSHCALTDFNILSDMQDALRNEWNEAGKDWFEDGGYDTYLNLKEILNYVEDRRIDNFIYTTAPGYKAYYKAMYNKYFEANIITKALKSGDKREVTRENYMFRIINFTNTATDLDAMPGLRDIWDALDLRNIGRLTSTKDALEVSRLIDAIIIRELENVATEEVEQEDATPGDGADQGTEQGTSGTNDTGSTSDDGTTAEGDDATSTAGNTDNELTPRQAKQLDNAIKKQKDFMNGEIKKSNLSKQDAAKVEAMVEADVEMRQVGTDVTKYRYHTGEYVKQRGTECIVIKNMTESLIQSGLYRSVFTTHARYGTAQELITKGTQLGTMLGRKLQIRNEDTTLKTTRLRTGKIDRRLVSSLGYGAEAVFSRLDVDTVNPVVLYISIDASGSMNGDEWNQSQISAVAIAKAASMVSNMDVVITYRTTDYMGNKYLPVMLVAYDSRKDRFSKITRLFSSISCCGTTPEGLCFEAIMKEMSNIGKGTDIYFLNFSDGAPNFDGHGINYGGESALRHTRKQVENMKSAGIKVLSYFISPYAESSMKSFKQMYGKDAERIDPTKITALAKSLNKRFATKG